MERNMKKDTVLLLILIILIASIISRFYSINNPLFEIIVLFLFTLLSIYIAQIFNICEFSLSFLTKKNLLVILFGVCLLVLLDFIFSYLIITFWIEESLNEQFINKESLLTQLIAGCLVAPIIEEIIFRGLIIGRLFINKPYIGIVVTSVVFGLLHFSNIFLASMYIFSGLIFSIAYYKTKKLEVSISMHIINNLFWLII
ncbi:CPBP family intramembrane metalloprotease [Clostridioides mangenotii]|uniref:CPBP family intramembrane glutamic endopeptidase n=1 Tax=Metaclostridioides mangenotii TaxID=1540 RepID=UPI00214A4C77|nr:CPBP family intramembrane glutamic endopeptidase [Clostridioides mangenotii]MCR1954569.1 CPBP family intramembrane metalloprotease [Clostridioides mangenotii]